MKRPRPGRGSSRRSRTRRSTKRILSRNRRTGRSLPSGTSSGTRRWRWTRFSQRRRRRICRRARRSRSREAAGRACLRAKKRRRTRRTRRTRCSRPLWTSRNGETEKHRLKPASLQPNPPPLEVCQSFGCQEVVPRTPRRAKLVCEHCLFVYCEKVGLESGVDRSTNRRNGS